MAQVRIHSRDQTTDPADPAGVAPALRVIYSTAKHPPRDVVIPGEAPTDDDVAEAIRQDLAQLVDQVDDALEL